MYTESKDNIWMCILSHTVKVYGDENEAWEEIAEEMVELWSLAEGSNVK